MVKSYIVYMHLNKQNNKVYIGITCQVPFKRWQNGEGYKKSTHFYRAINKYGWNNFEHLILYTNLTQEEAILKEKELIQFFDATNPEKGYNLSPGGQTGPKDFTKIKESSQQNKRFGKDNVNSIRVLCKETQEVFGSMSEAARWSGTDSAKISYCCKGIRKHAGHHPIDNSLLSWEITNKEVTAYCHAPQNKNPIKKVQCIETQIIYNSASEAMRQTGINGGNIGRCCQGKRKTAGGLHWQYI